MHMSSKSLLKDPFISMVVYAFFGGVAGILAGFVLMFLILGLAFLVVTDPELMDEFMQGVVPVFSMGAGAIIGGLLGGVVGIKKAK